MKAGTTSLYQYLRAHPDVFMPETKELDFFASERLRSLGMDWYEGQFADAGNEVAVGEASPRYAMFPTYGDVAGRIHAVLPGVRLLYVVRHPIERMISHYNHRVRANEERDPIERALRGNPVYLDVSRYGYQLEQYERWFPRARIHVIVSERMRDHRSAVLGDALSFMGADPDLRDAETLDDEHNVTEGKNVPRTLTAALMRLPAWNAIAPHVPEPIKAPGRRLSHRRFSAEQPSLSAGLTRELEGRLAEDVASLRRYLGAGFDGWGLA